MDKRYFSKKVVEWYELNKRDLPWRTTKDPYKVWLSEIILQQTRVNQGLPYYLRFIENFPDVFSLANASEQAVLRLWQGLGYYTRARNLHRCAKMVVAEYNGVFPNTFDDLRKLPGIGDYTAAAIASICFRQPVAVVDGNVYRVLSRIFGIETSITSLKGKKEFFELANALIDSKKTDVYNQGMMEFGALFCTPKNPDCQSCPFKSTCVAHKNSLQHVLPIKDKAKNSRKRYFYYFAIKKGSSFLMQQRNQKDIWHGLYDFYCIEKEKSVALSELRKEKGFPKTTLKNIQTETGYYKHVLSHQIIFAKFFILEIADQKAALPDHLRFYSKKKMAELPKPVLISRFLDDHKLL